MQIMVMIILIIFVIINNCRCHLLAACHMQYFNIHLT